MQLSEAMRLGSMVHPQGFGRYMTRDVHRWLGWTVETVKTCAFGAALVAEGWDINTEGETGALDTRWPIVTDSAACPVSGCEDDLSGDSKTVGRMVVHLNDDHRWMRERIADWVQVQEELEAAAKANAEDLAFADSFIQQEDLILV